MTDPPKKYRQTKANKKHHFFFFFPAKQTNRSQQVGIVENGRLRFGVFEPQPADPALHRMVVEHCRLLFVAQNIFHSGKLVDCLQCSWVVGPAELCSTHQGLAKCLRGLFVFFDVGIPHAQIVNC